LINEERTYNVQEFIHGTSNEQEYLILVQLLLENQRLFLLFDLEYSFK